MQNNPKLWITTSALYLIILFPSALNAEETTRVYKTVHPDGSVTYSDQANDQAQEMKVRPVETIPAIEVRTEPQLQNSKRPEQPASYYKQFKVLSPENDTAFYSGSGNVEVLVEVEPPLRGGDQIRLTIDGRTVASQRSTSFTVKTMDRGTHTARVDLLDTNGNVLKSRQSVFTVHRPSIRQ